MDRFSPVAPAHIRVHVLPVGSIAPTAFKTVLDQLQTDCSILQLDQVHAPDAEQILLSPKAYPQGRLFLNYTTFGASEQEQQLSPFELFREPLIVLGVADGLSLDDEARNKELKAAAEYLRERHPRVVLRHLLLLQETDQAIPTGNNVTTVKDENHHNVDGTPLKQAACEVAARFLAEFSTYAKAMQASPTVQTPGRTSKSLQGTTSARGKERRPRPMSGSGSGTATPTQNTELSSPIGEQNSRPPSRGVGSPPPRGPASSFEQIQRNALNRSDSGASNRSRGGNRASSEDRASVHGFGPEMSKSKTKERGRARVGIVIAHIHMMAGQWSEALRMLTEHTNVARKLNDHLWHAKGLEGIVVSMLLLAWARLEFSIPSICYPASERGSSSSHSHVQKLSVHLPSDFRPADAAHEASVRRLSTSLPDLLKQILSLYGATEGALELHFLVVAEVKIRFCDLIAVLLRSKGELAGETLNTIVQRRKAVSAASGTVFNTIGGLSKNSVAAVTAQAQPQDDDEVALPDYVQLLTGMYGIYASLSMDRKKALVLKDLITTLTIALHQARKVGAAEAGIHPAASITAEPSMDPTIALATNRGGVNAMVGMIAQIFGIELLPLGNATNPPHPSMSMAFHFGNGPLKSEVMRLISTFYDASLDPYGVLRLESSFLKSCAPGGALDPSYPIAAPNVSKEEQERHAFNLTRTAQVASSQGYSDVLADYWDPFLLRAVEFAEPDLTRTLIPRSKIEPQLKAVDQQTPGNPLLYDPNASRSGTAVPVRKLMVRNEAQQCSLTLQNPLDITIEIESIILVTEGNERLQLETVEFKRTILEPRRFQQVSFSISPTSLGDFNITGAHIKLANCWERFFPIFYAPWASSPQLLVKKQGQHAITGSETTQTGTGAITSVVTAHALPAMPLLDVEHLSVDPRSLMLLDGEHQTIDVIVRNIGTSGPAAIFEVVEGQGLLRLVPTETASPEHGEHKTFAVVQPGESVTMSFDVSGKAGISKTRLDLYYAPSPLGEDDRYARVLSVPFAVTIDAALQVHHARVVDIDENAFALSFDLANYWPKPLHYSSVLRQSGLATEQGVLAPGEVARVSLHVSRWPVGNRPSDEVYEGLLRRVEVLWRMWDGGRFGKVDLRGLGLTKEQLEVVRGPQYRMRMQLVKDERLRVGSFAVVRVTFVNHSVAESGSLVCELRLPSEERRVASVGVLHRLLPHLAVGDHADVDFAVCPLMLGSTMLHAVAKEVVFGVGKERGKGDEVFQAATSLMLTVDEK